MGLGFLPVIHTTEKRAIHTNAPKAAVMNKILPLGTTFIRMIIVIRIENSVIVKTVCFLITFVRELCLFWGI